MSNWGEKAPISLFYSYSHRDEKLRQKLEVHLASLRRSGMITEWHDRNIEIGQEWEKEIDRHLSSADIILLLVSASFIASEYCWSVEVKKALERHDRGEAKVIPVILRPCRWAATPFAKLQAAPKNAKPVSLWADQDEAFDDVVSKIERVVAELRQKRAAAETPVPIAPAPPASPPSTPHPGPLPRAGEGGSADPAPPHPPADAGLSLSRRERETPAAEGPLSRRERDGVRAVPKDGIYIGVDPRELPDLAVFKDIDAPWCPEMVVVPAGEVLMGSPKSDKEGCRYERPQHRVTIGYRFAIGRYVVTFDEYDHFCAATRREKPGDQGWRWGRGRLPVINVSWRDARAYAEWLAEVTGTPYRLPSEAEWEYACRAGTTTHYSFGDAITDKDANFAGKVDKTTEVGAYPANTLGLYDMHGNVWEWVEDVWHGDYQGAPADGSAWTDGEGRNSSRFRVVRGGSWYEYPRDLRSAVRRGNEPANRNYKRGFRIARMLD